MLINKWLITDKITDYDSATGGAGICLFMRSEPEDTHTLYNSVQHVPPGLPLTILLSGEYFKIGEQCGARIAKIVGLFFMPAYGLINYQPLLFVQNETPALTNFLERLIDKCKKQGFRNIVVKKIDSQGSNESNEFVYLLDALTDFDLNAEIRKWINENIKGRNPPQITLMIPADAKESINNVFTSEDKVKKTEDYSIAATLYRKQQLIDDLNHELYLKAINEKNVRFYLSIQKEERAKGLKYYYYEYEILPKWYKQFGHIIKVIMGKRTFRSLFSDNVKKYKD